jgi:site-specific recombinase XerD
MPWPLHSALEIQTRRAQLNAFLRSKEFQAFRDRLPPDLARCLDETRWSQAAKPNTQRAYENDWRHYQDSAAREKIDPLMPTPEFWKKHFTRYATEPIRDGLPRRYGTVERHAAGVAALFRQHGLPSPTRTFEHQQLMKGLSLLDDRPTRKAVPLLGQARTDLLQSVSTSSLRALRDRALARLGANRGWRAATKVSIRIENLKFGKIGVRIGLRDQKTSRDRRLIYVGEPHRKGHVNCAACAMQDLKRELGRSEGPLFCAIDRWGHVSERPLVPKSVTDILRKSLRAAGRTDSESYSSHSYRHGVVTSCAQAHWPLAEIMLVTLHRSERALREYIQVIDPWYDAPKHSVLDEPDQDSDPERGWKH